MKLVKNTKVVKLPRNKGSVQSAFRRAIEQSREQNWTKVIIIGQGQEAGGYKRSIMLDINAIGLLETAKYYILNEE